MIGGMSAVLLFGVQIFYYDKPKEKQYRMQLLEEAKVMEAKYERHLISKSQNKLDQTVASTNMRGDDFDDENFNERILGSDNHFITE